MRVSSLALRLFLWATGWTVVILIVTGIVLSTLYRNAVERAFDRRLDVYLRTLVADVASPEEGNDKFPQSIGEPLFDLRFEFSASLGRQPDLRCPGRIPAGLCARAGGRAAASCRAHHRSRRRWPLPDFRGRRRERNRQ